MRSVQVWVDESRSTGLQDMVGCWLTWLEGQVQCRHLLEGSGEGAEEVQSRGHHQQGHRGGGRQEAAVQQRLLVGMACHISQHRASLQLVDHLHTTTGWQASNHQSKQAGTQLLEPPSRQPIKSVMRHWWLDHDLWITALCNAETQLSGLTVSTLHSCLPHAVTTRHKSLLQACGEGRCTSNKHTAPTVVIQPVNHSSHQTCCWRVTGADAVTLSAAKTVFGHCHCCLTAMTFSRLPTSAQVW